MKTKVFVLGAKQYNFKEEGTGRQMSGTTVFYVDPHYEEEGVQGHVPLKASLPFESFGSFVGPGYYDMLSRHVRSGQQLALKAVGFEFLESVSF